MYYITFFSNDSPDEDIEQNEKIEVSKVVFDNSQLISESLNQDQMIFPLPKKYFDKDIITALNDLIEKSVFPKNDSMTITKILSLMHFLNIQAHTELLMDKLTLSENLTDNNFYEFVDKDFADNYNLVSLLWCKTKEKKVFFKLSKFNYALLSLDINSDFSTKQEDLNNAPNNLKEQIIILNARGRTDITDVSMFGNLEELDASNAYFGTAECGIDQKSIQNLMNLRKLNAHYNRKIKDVNHMTKLEELDASEHCGIGQKGIQNITELRKLNVYNNSWITDLNHLQKLEELDAGWGCGIAQSGIVYVTTLKKLDANDNPKIMSVNHMVNLEELHASNRCGINQKGIQRSTSLRKLNVWDNAKIIDVHHMEKLEELNAAGEWCGISQKTIQEITWLRKLDANYNPKITDVNHMTKLEKLDACNSSKFTM